MSKEKFEFGPDFQELILQYTVTDTLGFKALELYEDTYFTLLHHAVIAFTLKKYYKKYKRVPDETYLREYLRTTLVSEKVISMHLSEEDKDLISNTISKVYAKKVADPEIIIDKCVNFARYIKFKHEMESIDISKFDSYESAIGRLQKANTVGIELKEDYGTFLVSGIKDRAYKRDQLLLANPTPYWQLNNLLNGGGSSIGSVYVLMSKEKRFKSGFLINTAIGYMKRKKKVFYVDLENGEMQITVRGEQSISNKEQSLIISGDYDKELMKILRKYQRLGSEMAIKKFPSLSTTCDAIQNWLDKVKRDFDISFNVGIFDYGPLLGSISGKEDEVNRISDAHLDMKNLSNHNKLECVWSAAHITRDGNKRIGTKFQSTDIAKCIDIPRHIDALFGLQENEEEMEAKIMRLEVIEQRNGMREGNCLFWVDIPRQRMREISKTELKRYHEQVEVNKQVERKSDL